MDYGKLTQDDRDRLLKNELSAEKVLFIEKYALQSSSDLKWYTKKNNTPARLYFSHHFVKTNGVMEILFRKYQFCFAKLKYFRANMQHYQPAKYHPAQGFINTELWDAEFFMHKNSEKYVDLRFLQQITELDVFLNLTAWLENPEENKAP